MTNIKDLNPKLHSSEKFMLASIQFLAIKDAIKNAKAYATAENLATIKKELKHTKQIAIESMHSALTPEELSFFYETFPKLTDATFAKYLLNYTLIKEPLLQLYMLSYNYNIDFVKGTLTKDMIDNYKAAAAEMRKSASEYYNWR